MLNRRDFVATVGLSLVAGASSRAAAANEPVAIPAIDSSSDWAAVRAQFDLAPDWMHFSQFYIVSHPKPVRDAIERFRGMLDTQPFATVEHGMGFDAFLGEDTKQDPFPVRVQHAAAGYIGGRAEEVALTDSTTQGLALIYHGLTLKPGDEVLCTTHDHYVHHEAIRLAVEKSGASWRRVPLYEDPTKASADEMVDRLKRAIGPYTRVVGITWVHSSSGVKIPVRALARGVTEVNANRGKDERILVVLDAVHGFGNQEEQVAQLGVDFAAAGTHKWIFAPRGTGILWVPEKNWDGSAPRSRRSMTSSHTPRGKTIAGRMRRRASHGSRPAGSRHSSINGPWPRRSNSISASVASASRNASTHSTRSARKDWRRFRG